MLLEMDGPKVRAMRQEAGMTRRELADASGVSVGTVQNIETGNTHPRPRTARAVAAVFDVDPRSIAWAAGYERPGA